jgi:pimeloyl-ACP methyl ester carboxylesterase
MHLPNKRYLRLLLFIVAVIVLSACASQSPGLGPTSQTIEFQDCQLSAPGLAYRQEAQCGSFTVPEDWENPSGREIELNIAVVPALTSDRMPDPLFFITGGPGQAATESYVQIRDTFQRINDQRDIVLVDQRGTGKSAPITCPEPDDPEAIEDDDEALGDWVMGCLAEIDADPRFYTTPVAVQDLEAVRQALGYQKINLYGVSYGTRVALTYLDRYPDALRTVILDGVVPQDEALGLEVAKDAQRAVDLILARCSNDPGCNETFQDVGEEFQDLLSVLADQPVTTSLMHPTTGELTEVEFTRDQFVVAVRLLTYAPETVALLPLLIHTAHSEGDFTLLAAQYLVVNQSLGETITIGMNYSVLCSEDMPFLDDDEALQASEGTYFGDLQVRELKRICQFWPQGVVPEGYKHAVTSDLPVLLLSGEADPVTPPENAEKVAASLPNSLHLVAPGQGHNVILRGCMPKIAATFIENGSATGLDTACLDDIKPMPFFLNFGGTAP